MTGQLRAGIIRSFHVGTKVPREVDSFAADLKQAALTLDRNDDPPPPRVCHLTGNGSFPNHVEESELVVVEDAAHRVG